MADKEGSEKGSCCSGGKCCGCRCVKTLVTLLIGGIVGYLLGGHCAYKKGCPLSNNAMMSAPAAPQK